MQLNKNQIVVILADIDIIVLMGLLPPWICGIHTTDSSFFRESAACYSFIFVPPAQTAICGGETTYDHRLDYGRLFIQWLMVIVVAGGLIFLFREPSQK